MLRLDPFTLVVRAIALLISIPVHEAAHAWAADKLGDPTGRYYGRLTLNPTAHFDLMGSISMLVAGIGWAKPVPVNPLNFKDSKKGMALTAAAGPLSNLLMAFIFMIMYKICGRFLIFFMAPNGISASVNILQTLWTVFSTLCATNISLAIFNLMPFPPFDGSRIFNYFLSDKLYFKIMQYEQQIFMAVFIMLMLGVFDRPLNMLTNAVWAVLSFLTSFVEYFFSMLFATFLNLRI